MAAGFAKQAVIESLDARRLFAVTASIGTFSDTTLTEGAVGGYRSFLVAISSRQTTDTVINFAWGGTAGHPVYITGGEDFTTSSVNYTFPNDQTDHPYVSIPAGSTYTTVVIYPESDFQLEKTETLTVSLLPGNYTIGTPNTLNYIIQDAPPSVATYTRSTDDAMVVNNAYANTNFGNSSILETRSQRDITGESAQSYLRFDLTGVNSVTSATLQLGARLSSASSSGVAVNVYSSSNTSWSESRITWNSKPATTTLIRSFTVTGTSTTNYRIDVTAFLQAELAAGRRLVTFVLINPSVSTPFVVFDSEEAFTNKRPQLQFRQ